MKITIPYTPRPLWEKEIHPSLEKFRYSVLVCHRRFGKTVGTVNHMIKMAILNDKPAPLYAYVAPFRKQAKKVAWEYLKFYTSVIPGRKINETDLYVELPARYKNRPGARLYIVGADNPDNLRGEYYDGVILDEYAQIKPTLFGAVIRPALADRKGWAIFIGTPKGQNQFYDIYQKAVADPKWYSCLYRVDESGVIDQAEIDEMKSMMTDNEMRQELLCDFTASASDVVIPIDLVTDASKRELTEQDVIGQPVIVGVDVARFGDDRTAITVRQGLHLKKLIAYTGLGTMDVADRVMMIIGEYHPHAVFVDAGAMGAGVIDRLRQLRYQVSEVSFGGKALEEDRYANLRAEMYFKIRDWLLSGGALPDISGLKTELSIVEYKFNPGGKIILEPKDKLKGRTGYSPDLADSLALTFARPVYIGTGNPLDDDMPEEYDALGAY
ncbi:MAG: terminase family protein [Candidatus Cloacimonetes bacterium]|nr:terminase family protein [Candidatus Cloacimonadota bacterium]